MLGPQGQKKKIKVKSGYEEKNECIDKMIRLFYNANSLVEEIKVYFWYEVNGSSELKRIIASSATLEKT